MATTISTQDIVDAKRDIEDIGKAVNEKVVVSPRYGGDFKSLPMIAAESEAALNNFESTAQDKVNEWDSAINLITQEGGVPALAISTAGGENQQEVNDFGGAKWRNKAGGYAAGATIKLDNGEIVKSTVAGNNANPNENMTGWVKTNAASQIITESGDDLEKVSRELYVFRKPVLYAAGLKVDGSDQLSELNALAAEAANKRLTLILPQGTICISDEFIPPDGLKMEGINADSVNSTFNLTGSTIKWIGADGTNKAVIRASRSAIGVTPTAPVSAVSLKGIYVDAIGCDCGVYFRNFTNESYAGEIVVRNSKKVGIAGVQMWFSRFGALTAAANQNVGMCFGEPMFGEVGAGSDGLDVNAIPFSYLRAHSNGRDNTYVDNPANIRRGAGIILKTRSCSFASIQSEKNYGVGMIELASSRTNSYSAIYLEGNCSGAPTESIGLINYSNNLNIQSIYLSVGEKFRNMASERMTIQNGMKDGSDSPFSASNVGGLWYGGISGTLLLNATNAEFESFVYSVINSIAVAQDVDINYSSAKPFGTKTFYVPRTINGAYLVIAPRGSATARTIVYNLDGTTRNANTSAFTVGTAQKFTVGTLTKGFHTLSIGDPGASELLNCDVYIMNAVLPSGYTAKSFAI